MIPLVANCLATDMILRTADIDRNIEKVSPNEEVRNSLRYRPVAIDKSPSNAADTVYSKEAYTENNWGGVQCGLMFWDFLNGSSANEQKIPVRIRWRLRRTIVYIAKDLHWKPLR